VGFDPSIVCQLQVGRFDSVKYKLVSSSCLSLSSCCCSSVVAVVESSVTVVYPRFDQTPAGGFDDLVGLLCVQRRLKSKSGRNETLVFAAVVESKLFFLLTYIIHSSRDSIVFASLWILIVIRPGGRGTPLYGLS